VHFHAKRETARVELFWEVRNAPALRWRVLRSEHEFAASAGALPDSGQTVVMEGSDTHLTDTDITDGQPYFYTVFAQDADGIWHAQAKARLAHRERLRWLHPSEEPPKDQLDADWQRSGDLDPLADPTIFLR
jgi:hypothetical protein